MTPSPEITITYNYSPVTPPVPEPSTWAMLTLGFAGVGLAYRRRNSYAKMAINAA
jgi:PEP-CTERM motif